MKEVNLNKQEIRWIENLIMNEIIAIGNQVPQGKELKGKERLSVEKKKLQDLYQKITSDKMRW